MRSSLNILEFDKIKNQISNLTFSLSAHEKISQLNPSISYQVVDMMLNQTNEMLKIIVKYGSLPFMEHFDNTILAKNNTLERIYYIEELLYLRLYLILEQEISKFYQSFDSNDKYANLEQLFSLNDHLRLTSIFNTTFTDQGEIFDNATKELKSIRTTIKKLQFDLDNRINKLLTTYESYLTDPVVVTRNNRLCLPVKETYKNKVKGVVHDISQSKQTIFIEPEISLQISAEIEMNKLLEEKEITKILTNLTLIVNDNFKTLKENFNKLIELDYIHAKAKYSLTIDGVKPKINNEGNINLINAKHPLIDKTLAVPISLHLNKKDNVLLITGPNTGGKTVTLKTIGLLTAMIQSGILIPVNEESSLAVFDNIFADIGDEQSIVNSLSTFSSHIVNIIRYLKNLTNNSLILLDELGSGTDPNEGVALAIAIIEEFVKKDVRLVVTSHYSELKTYAYETEGIITASVAFDKDTLKPLYYLQHGISGDSHARLIASRYGMSKAVINKANEIYQSKETDLAKIMTKLNEERVLFEEERRQMNVLKDRYIKDRNDLERTKERLINEQAAKLEEIRSNEETKWNKKEKEINELIAVLELEQNLKQHQITELKGKVSSKVKKDVIYDEEQVLKLKDKVYIKSYQQYGEIVEINKDKYRVVFGLFDLWFKNSDLKLVEEVKKQSKKVVTKTRNTKTTGTTDVTREATLRLDLRGYRYEEVHEAIDKAFDNALLSNLSSLTIIHGFGTGAVREAVYNYLQKSSLVKSYRYGGEGEGLNGATIVTLK